MKRSMEVLDEIEKIPKYIVVDNFDEHCDSNLYTLNWNLHDYTVEDLRIFVAMCVIESSLYEHYNVYIKHCYEKTSQSRATRIMETVNNIQRCYERAV